MPNQNDQGKTRGRGGERGQLSYANRWGANQLRHMSAGIIPRSLSLSLFLSLFLYLLPMHIKTIPSPFLLPRLVSLGSPVLPCWLAEAFHFRRCRHFSNQMRKQCKTRGQKFPLKCNRCKLEEGRQTKKPEKDKENIKRKRRNCAYKIQCGACISRKATYPRNALILLTFYLY